VMTGIGTLLHDDPALTARPEEPGLAVLQPLRVIVDSQLQTPPAARTLCLPGEVVIFTTRDASPPLRQKTPGGAHSASARVRVERVERAGDTQHCELRAVLERLAALEINDLWVEAGPGLNGALLDAGLVDELIVYLAPQVLGDGARGMF